MPFSIPRVGRGASAHREPVQNTEKTSLARGDEKAHAVAFRQIAQGLVALQ